MQPKLLDSIVLREELDEWGVLFDPDTGNTFGLNPTSVLVTKLLDGKNEVAEIIARVKESCDNVPENVAADVEEFINSLKEKELLEQPQPLSP
ncbi:PqqD family peptide modification chaperone [Candidatus Saganbacteria bacterium]|nr:PqqD family peptide modification chaperone [Candidatus Saganbacteria bacterium]